MSMTPIQPSQIPLMAQPALNPMELKKKLVANPLQQPMMHLAMPKLGAGLAKDLKSFLDLKQTILRARAGKGPKRSRRGRRQHLQRRMRQLMARMSRMMRHYSNHGCEKSQRSDQSHSAKNVGDFSFLNDPNLSLSDKIEMFLQKIIKDSEEKIEKLMKDHEAVGKSDGKSKGKSKGKGLKKFASVFIKVATVVATAVASVYGTPAAGAAVAAGGAALSKAVDSAGSEKSSEKGSTDGTKSSTESDKRMLMFKIQKLQSHVQEMLSFFSTKLKKENDLANTMIRNMA